jgi:hypothetical protein
LDDVGTSVIHCRKVSPDARDYFQCDIERAKKVTTDRDQEKLRQEAAAAEGSNTDGEYDEEDEVQCATRLSRAEEEYQQEVLGRGGQYEHGDSGFGGGDPFQRSLKELVHGGRPLWWWKTITWLLVGGSGMVQPRIDTALGQRRVRMATDPKTTPCKSSSKSSDNLVVSSIRMFW